MSKGEPLFQPLNTRDEKESSSQKTTSAPQNNNQTYEEDKSGSSIYWYTNLIYGTIKQFLSGVIVIKSNMYIYI